MENSADWNLISELTQGRELAKQLQIHINAPYSSHESRELLVHKILNSYEKVLNMLKGNAGMGVGETQQSRGTTITMSESRSQQSTGITIGMSESPRSLSGSPRSEDSDREFRDLDPKDASRKRKTMPRWTKHVQVCPGTGLEGPLDDGSSWRKYGQKDILGAKYPSYHGTTSGLSEKPETSLQRNHQQVISQPQQNRPEILLSFQRDLKVNTKDLDTNNQQLPSFDFPSTSTAKLESYPFFPSLTENNSTGNLCPPFVPPATSGSNYFSVSPTHIRSVTGNQNSYTSESEFTDLISATNSPTVGLDFPFSQMEFDPNFTFDNSGFFS